MTCEGCEALQKQIEEMGIDLDLAQKDIVRLRRVEQALRNKLSQKLDDEPVSADVKEVANYWQLKVRPRARIPSDGKRADVIRKALKGNSVNNLKRAIDGITLDDWCMGRHPKTKNWPVSSLKNDLQHIMGDETLIEKWVGVATESDVPAIEKVISRLDGVKETGSGSWTALCPAHLDTENSLTVSVGEKGVLVNCFAGCEFPYIVKALGMQPGELFEQSNTEMLIKSTEPAKLPTDGQIVTWNENLLNHKAALKDLYERRGWSAATIQRLEIGLDGDRITIPVYDEDSQLENVLRYKPNGTPKVIGLRGRKRNLYKLGHSDDRKIAWIVEGELDAILAHQSNQGSTVFGLPGAASWKDEWNEQFSNFDRVMIVMDCDDAGRTAAEKIYETLSKITNCTIIDLDNSRYDGYDFTDFIKEGKDITTVNVASLSS